MANYENLKNAIKSVIKANGNQEITGDIMQQTLVTIVDVLGKGYQFMGAAIPGTDPGIPDQKVCYLAMEKGVYSNFNALEVGEHEIAIMMYDSRWRGITILSNVPDVNAVSYLKQVNANDRKAQARNNIGIPDYATFDNVGQLMVNIGKYAKYSGESDTIFYEEDGVLNINSNILEIDFCGATLRIKDGIKGHARCKIKNLTIIMLPPQGTSNRTAIEGFGYVENVYVTTEKDGTHTISYGFKNCDHLFNCKVDGTAEDTGEDGAATGFYYCNYLFQCRYSGQPTVTYCRGFEHCNFISQCYMKYGYASLTFKYSLGNNRHVESLIGISYNGDIPVFETFADTNHIRIGDYNMDNFIKLLSSDGGTGKTKLYAKPDDKPGMATVLLDTAPVNWAVARRTSVGTLKAKDAVEEDDTVTKKQLDKVKTKINSVLQIVDLMSWEADTRKTALDEFKTNWLALGNTDLNGARFVAKSHFELPEPSIISYVIMTYSNTGMAPEGYTGIALVHDTDSRLVKAYSVHLALDGNFSYEAVRDCDTFMYLNMLDAQIQADYLKKRDDELSTASKQIVGAINEVNTLAKSVKAFGAIELKASDDAANKAALAAYLKILTDAGVSTTNGYSVPVRITGNSQEYHGMLNIGTGVLLSGVVTDVNENHHYPFNVSTTDGVITFDESNYFLEKTSNEVTEMLDAIKYSHTSVPFTDTTLSNKAQLEVFLSKVPDATVMHCTYKEIWAGTLHKINGDWYGLLVKNTNSPADNINIKLSADGTVITSNSIQ